MLESNQPTSEGHETNFRLIFSPHGDARLKMLRDMKW